MGMHEFYREAIETFPIEAESAQFSFFALGIPLPRRNNLKLLKRAETTEYLERCSTNGLFPFSFMNFEASDKIFRDKEKRHPVIIPVSANHNFDYRHLTSQQSEQITKLIIKSRFYHKLEFSLSQCINSDSLNAFRVQCLDDVFAQGYELDEGFLYKTGVFNGKAVNMTCWFGHYFKESKRVSINIAINENTSHANASLLKEWVKDIARKYSCTVK